MADNVASAEELICKLFNASIEPARKELQTLSEFASNELGIPSLSPWDMAYVSEKYRKSCFKYDDEAISEYFAFPKVLHGLFCVTAKLFGAQVTELSKQEQVRQHISVWHEDVKVFSVAVQGETVAYFYGDFYSRPSEKRGGAWMAPITTRWKHDNGKVTLPVGMRLVYHFTSLFD
jgi:oligopeptidase A